MHKSLPVMLGLGFGLASVIVAVVPAAAQEGVAIKNLLGQVGLIPREKDAINYRERAPLVIPPKTTLPPPSERYASSNPNWPVDPDVAAKRRRAAEERQPVTWSEIRRASDNNPRLSAEEMQRGRVAGTQRVITQNTHRGDNARDVLMANPEGPRSSDTETPVLNGEPVRTALSDPPTGMRRPAQNRPLANDFTPKVDQQQADANPINWLTRKFKGDDDE